MAETLACRMARDGTSSALFAVADSEPTFADEFRRRLKAAGVLYFTGSRQRSPKYSSLGSALAIIQALREFDPDVVHLHTEIPEFAWALASLRSTEARDRPVIRTIHNATLWPRWKSLGRFAETRLRDAVVVATSLAAANAFNAWTQGRSEEPTLIYNGVEWPPSITVQRPLLRPRLLFAGRFEYQKGIDTLLAAIKQLPNEDFELTVLGNGTLESEVHRRVGKDPRVTVGPPDPDLREKLGAFDAIVMPSRFEGLPLLALEVAGVGLPVIATEAAGLDEVLPANYPNRAKPGDSTSFADAIRNFLRHPQQLQLAAEQTRAGVRERFGMDRMVRDYASKYDQAKSEPRNRHSLHR